MSPRALSALVAIAGLLVIAGGAVGYLSKGSLPSLIAAGAAGLVWVVCAVGIARGRPWGSTVAMAVAVLLALAMAWRWASGASIAAALPVIAISIAVFTLLITARRLAK
jgi:uncharacterized membrane protein (UPF0136 family)